MNTQNNENLPNIPKHWLAMEGPEGKTFSVDVDSLSEMLKQIAERAKMTSPISIFHGLDWIHSHLVENAPDDVSVGSLKPYLYLLKELMYGIDASFSEIKK